MWPSLSALHSGGPNFKASLHPCGQAAKLSVGEKLFTGLFPVSPLSLMNSQTGFLSGSGGKHSAFTAVC